MLLGLQQLGRKGWYIPGGWRDGQSLTTALQEPSQHTLERISKKHGVIPSPLEGCRVHLCSNQLL